MSRRVSVAIAFIGLVLAGCCCNFPAPAKPLRQGGGARIINPNETEEERKARIEKMRVEREKQVREREAAQKPSPISRENYSQIKLGMTMEEVQEILGPGSETVRAKGLVTLTWQSAPVLLRQPTVIVITFENGRVAAKGITP